MHMLLVTLMALSWINTSYAGAGRALPTLEDPLIVESLFQSKQGEVHFVRSSQKLSAILRLDSGKLCTLSRIEGPGGCDDWFLTNKHDSPPARCEFMFETEDACAYHVRSEDLVPGSLFELVGTTLQGTQGNRQNF